MRLIVAVVLFIAFLLEDVRCDPKKTAEDNDKAQDSARNSYVPGGPVAFDRPYGPGYSGGRYNQAVGLDGGRYGPGYVGGGYNQAVGLDGGRYGQGYNYPYGGYGSGYNYRQGGRYGGQHDGRYGGYFPYNEGRYGGAYTGQYGPGRPGYNMGYRGYGLHMPYGSYGYGYNRRPQDFAYGYQGAYEGRYGPYSGYGRGDFGRPYSGAVMPGTMGFPRQALGDGFLDSFGGANVHSGRGNYYHSTSHGMTKGAPLK